MPTDRSPSAAVNTETTFWTSSWPLPRNQDIIPLLQPTATDGSNQSDHQDHRVGVWRQGDSFSFYTRSVQPGEVPCLGGSTHASQSMLARRAGHSMGCAWVNACQGKHHQNKSQKAVPVQPHVPTNICMRVPAGRCTRSHYMCMSDSVTVSNPPGKFSGMACGALWGPAYFSMYAPGNRDTPRSCCRSLPLCPHFIMALDRLFKFQTFSFKWILHTFSKITLNQFIF